jgi:hypothetical protein
LLAIISFKLIMFKFSPWSSSCCSAFRLISKQDYASLII